MAGFHDIIGHEKIKEHLQKAIGYQRVSHAYILSGEEGMGRKTIAKAFAMTLLCEKHGTEPCMECHSCKQFLSGNHPDVIWVTHEKPASIGVDDVRIQINDTVSIRPYSSPYKIYLVDEAEKMTVQAQNALLKTIEEPPGLCGSGAYHDEPGGISADDPVPLYPVETSSAQGFGGKRLPDGENGRFGWSGGYLCGVCERKFRKSDSSRLFGGVCTFVPRGADAA